VYVSRTYTSIRKRCNSQSIDISKILCLSTKSATLRSPTTAMSFHGVRRPNSIFIFDDVACDKLDAVREYFSMGRHANIDCFYLFQTYARIPKHLIRDNANLLILFKQESTNLKHVYNVHENTDMSYDEFCALCRDCWQQKYGFIVIDKDSALTNGRYRKGFK